MWSVLDPELPEKLNEDPDQLPVALPEISGAGAAVGVGLVEGSNEPVAFELYDDAPDEEGSRVPNMASVEGDGGFVVEDEDEEGGAGDGACLGSRDDDGCNGGWGGNGGAGLACVERCCRCRTSRMRGD